MPSNVEDIQNLIGRENIAEALTNRYMELKSARDDWEREKQELRDYIFATDTKTTSNAKLPWKNTTTVPKLCQIRDNLHSNYEAALFSNSEWLRFEGGDKDALAPEVKAGLTAYMRQKMRDSDFEDVVSQLLLDYIDYGNAYAEVEWVDERFTDAEGVEQVKYQGPRLVRIDPMEIVYDVTATEFTRTGKFIRRTMSMGDLVKYVEEHPDANFNQAVMQEIKDCRKALSGYSAQDINRAGSYMKDGFGSLNQYYNSGFVELIEYEGDYYDVDSDTLHKNQRITIVDRARVLRMEPIQNHMGRSLKEHVGWRKRPNNLCAMGPLDNLVGLQYRIDHLQNLKSDIFDLAAFPPLKVRGQVEDFEWGPFERIYMDEDADVMTLSVDTNPLNADMEIDWIERKMEELAGAPRQALGIRTPGEKTKYEVQTLENNAGRVFQLKAKNFERHFLQPLINSMLALARDKAESDVTVSLINPEYGHTEFLKVTPEMIRSRGTLRAVGAQHFAERANKLQNYNNFRNSAAGQDPSVLNHISGKKEAKFILEMLDLEQEEFYQENVRIGEQVESQRMVQQGQRTLQNEEAAPTLGEEEAIDQEAEQLQQGFRP